MFSSATFAASPQLAYGHTQGVPNQSVTCVSGFDCIDNNPCTSDFCSGDTGSKVCHNHAGSNNAGVQCRASAGDCDTPEFCQAFNNRCPIDIFKSAITECRSSVGICDVVETCTGTSAVCPTNAFELSGTECRGVAGTCDVSESCTGTSPVCPTNTFKSTATVCRGAAGDCDVSESCTGASVSCPADAFAPTGNVCGTPTPGVSQSCDGAGVCVSANSITCGAGTTLNPSNDECEADPQASQCGEGTTLNPSTNVCEANICEPKVDVCHKNKTTMNISLNALPTHLNHGDTVGPCE